MTCAVRKRSPTTAPGELAQHYSDAPDGVRVNMIMSLDGATTFTRLTLRHCLTDGDDVYLRYSRA